MLWSQSVMSACQLLYIQCTRQGRTQGGCSQHILSEWMTGWMTEWTQGIFKVIKDIKGNTENLEIHLVIIHSLAVLYVQEIVKKDLLNWPEPAWPGVGGESGVGIQYSEWGWDKLVLKLGASAQKRELIKNPAKGCGGKSPLGQRGRIQLWVLFSKYMVCGGDSNSLRGSLLRGSLELSLGLFLSSILSNKTDLVLPFL